MSQAPSQGPVMQVKPQPNIYSVLLIVAILVLLVAIVLVVMNLMAPLPNGYGLEIGDLFKPLENIPIK